MLVCFWHLFDLEKGHHEGQRHTPVWQFIWPAGRCFDLLRFSKDPKVLAEGQIFLRWGVFQLKSSKINSYRKSDLEIQKLVKPLALATQTTETKTCTQRLGPVLILNMPQAVTVRLGLYISAVWSHSPLLAASPNISILVSLTLTMYWSKIKVGQVHFFKFNSLRVNRSLCRLRWQQTGAIWPILCWGEVTNQNQTKRSNDNGHIDIIKTSKLCLHAENCWVTYLAYLRKSILFGKHSGKISMNDVIAITDIRFMYHGLSLQ